MTEAERNKTINSVITLIDEAIVKISELDMPSAWWSLKAARGYVTAVRDLEMKDSGFRFPRSFERNEND